MEKIVVTTDLSTNASAAIRFAIRLAKVRAAKLFVLHVYDVLKPFNWTADDFVNYKNTFVAKLNTEIETAVGKIAKSIGVAGLHFEVALENNKDVADGIIQFTEREQCHYLCIGATGAGFIAKLFGTHATQLIARSSIPVICVPPDYRSRRLKRVLYASDMSNYESELLTLLTFVRPMKIELAMVHITEIDGQKPDGTYIEKSIEKKMKYSVNVFSRDWDLSRAVIQGIREEAKRYRPSMLAFFTHQSRSFLDKLLLPANAAELNYYSKIPIISFKKE